MSHASYLPALRRYLVPGLVFQSVIVGGGYATGRELVEFFFPVGPLGGLLALSVAASVFGTVLAVAFEFARVTHSYDYRSFCRGLLGRAWPVFEVAYLVQLLLVLSVLASAAGELVHFSFGFPALAGTLTLAVLIGVLTFSGSRWIELALSSWSILLYAAYIALFFLTFDRFSAEISDAFARAPLGAGWASSGVLYSGYNLAILPAVLFAVVPLRRRRETLTAGLLAGVLAIIPAALFFVAIMAFYPEVGQQALPAAFLMAALDTGWLAFVFQLIVFGTFVETGTAMLHAVNERLAQSSEERGYRLPRLARPALSLLCLALAVVAGEVVGIVDLIASGYGVLTLVFIAVLVVPLLTVGLWRIVRYRGDQ